MTAHRMVLPASTIPIGVYRMTGFWRILCLAVSVAMIVGGIVAIIYTWLGTGADIPPNKGIFTAFAAGDVAMGCYIGASLLKGRITLYRNAIESAGVWKQYRLAKADIAGKLIMSLGAPTIVLYPKAKHGKKMMVSLTFTPDHIFSDWMDEIPPLTQAMLTTRNRQKSN